MANPNAESGYNRAEERLLVVEDDAVARQALCRLLEIEGWRCDTVGSGEEALEAAAKTAYSGALLDLNLPRMSGLDVLARLRERDNQLAVVVTTGDETRLAAIRALNAGADHYCCKPLDIDELFRYLDRALERRRLRLENIRLREKLANVLEHVPVGIAVTRGPDHEFEAANAFFRDLARLAHSEKEPIGKTVKQVFPKLQAGDWLPYFDQVLRKGVRYDRCEVPCEEFGGQGTFLDVSIIPYNEAGHTQGLVVVITDTTDKVRALKRQQQITHDLQYALHPQLRDAYNGIEIEDNYEPAYHEAGVGGDFYDVFALGPTRYGISLGDVSGKGLQAASHTAMLRHTIRTLARDDPRPDRVLTVLNRYFFDHAEGERFATIFYGLLDVEKATLVFANAGHEPGLLRVAHSDALTELAATGPALGVAEDVVYEQETISTPLDSCILLVTDGITEARQPGGDILGHEVLHEMLRQEQTLRALVAGLFQRALDHADRRLPDDAAILAIRMTDRRLPDDAAILAIRVTGEPPPG